MYWHIDRDIEYAFDQLERDVFFRGSALESAGVSHPKNAAWKCGSDLGYSGKLWQHLLKVQLQVVEV